MFYSKAGLSISMAALICLGLWSNKGIVLKSLRQFLNNKVYVGLTAVFLVYLLSGINSGDTNQWLKQIRIKLPFLILPFAFYLLGPMPTKWFKKLHIILACIGLISTVPVLINFMSNQTELISAIGRGQHIPTPIDHIHYSIILAYAALSLLLLLVDSCVSKSKFEKGIMATLFLLLGMFIHVLAVRSGLAIFYLGLTFISVWYIYSSKKYAIGAVTLIMILIAPFIMYKTTPSLNKKINYMVYDFEQYQKGEGKNYSDSERLMSYAIALDLWKESPVIGHGVGDLRGLMISEHKSRYGEKEKYIFPHNQFLYVLASVGFLGFLIFFVGLLSPILFSPPDPYVWLVYLTMLASFMVENTVQRAVSIAFFLLFILWSVGRQRACDISTHEPAQ